MCQQPLRVLQVITQSRVSGAEINMIRLCRGLLDRGHAVLVVTRPGSLMRESLARQGVPSRELSIHGKANLVAPRRLAAVIREWQPDLVNTHNSTASLWGGLAARLARTPVVAHVQGLHYSCTLWSCYGAADGLIACSDAVRRYTVGVGFAPHRVRRVYNAVDPAEFVPKRPREAVRQALGLARDELAVGAFAHLSRKKGHADLLEAVAKVPIDVPFRLFCVGNGPCRDALLRQASGLGIAGRVHFLDYRRDVANLMCAMDAMALPSHREPFGIVYVEAMLARLPVIACNAGGAPEVVEEGVTGYLVPPHDPDRLAAALTALLTSPARRRRMGEAGRNRAVERFSLDRMVTETESMYREVIRSRPLPRRTPRS